MTHLLDGKANVVNCYEYDAFGNTTESKEEVYNPFRYAGEQYDTATGQYYLRARFYNPVIARFTQEDVYRGDGLNLYAYVSNNPVKYVDPSGYKQCKADAVQGTETPAKGTSVADGVLKGKDVYGPYYDEAMELYKKNPDWFCNPDEATISMGKGLAGSRAEYEALVRKRKLEKGHHRQGLAFGEKNVPANIQFTGESTIRNDKISGLDLDFYYTKGYGKENAKVLKIHQTKSGIYVFGNNSNHTEATIFQNKVLKWQRDTGLR